MTVYDRKNAEHWNNEFAGAAGPYRDAWSDMTKDVTAFVQGRNKLDQQPSTAMVVREGASSQALSIFEMSPMDKVAYATQVANAIAPIIEKQKLYSLISGKKHVMVEGWNVMGMLLGVLPKERGVIRLDDGSYEGAVDLVNVASGLVVGGATHLCSVNEKRWSQADEYAVRSMAVTRATGKAFRLGFSWVMKLAGYEPTPYEEMPTDDIPFAPTPTKSAPVASRVTKASASSSKYDNNLGAHQDALAAKLKQVGVDDALWPEIGSALHGKTWDKLKETVEAVKGAFEASLSQ